MTDNSKRTGATLEAHYRFLMWLAPTLEKFPRSHKFTIGDRIEALALDVLEALIEATYSRDRSQHLRRANLGIEKLRFLLRLAAHLTILDRRRYEHAAHTLGGRGRQSACLRIAVMRIDLGLGHAGCRHRRLSCHFWQAPSPGRSDLAAYGFLRARFSGIAKA